MKFFAIESHTMENYAAHDGFDGNYRWKVKPGGYYLVEAVNQQEAREVAALLEDEPNDVCYEVVDSLEEVDSSWESDFVKSQKEYGGDWDTLYCDSHIRKGTNGHWYMKRGYIVGQMMKDSHPELVGKFRGWVDDLTTGECKCQMVGDRKLPLDTAQEA